MPWDQQVMTLLNAAPIIGYLLGYDMGGATQGGADALSWIRRTFSQDPD